MVGFGLTKANYTFAANKYANPLPFSEADFFRTCSKKWYNGWKKKKRIFQNFLLVSGITNIHKENDQFYFQHRLGLKTT